MKKFLMITTALAISSLLLAACSSQKGARIKGANEPDLVDSDKAGIGVYDRLVQGGLAKLLGGKYQQDQAMQDGTVGLVDMESAGSERLRQELQAKAASGGKIRIAFIGIENSSEEELGSNQDAMYDQVDNFLVNSAFKFEVISRRAVEAVMRSTGLRRADDLFVASKRDQFVTELRSAAGEPDYFLWGKINSQTSRSGGSLADRSYQIRFELVRAIDGQTVGSANHEGATKEYRR